MLPLSSMAHWKRLVPTEASGSGCLEWLRQLLPDFRSQTVDHELWHQALRMERVAKSTKSIGSIKWLQIRERTRASNIYHQISHTTIGGNRSCVIGIGSTTVVILRSCRTL